MLPSAKVVVLPEEPAVELEVLEEVPVLAVEPALEDPLPELPLSPLDEPLHPASHPATAASTTTRDHVDILVLLVEMTL